MILVYCDHITPRHRFIFDFIFRDILGSDYRFVTDQHEFAGIDGPKINYSHSDLPGCIQFRPHSILSEKGVTGQHFSLKPWNPGTLEPWNPGTLEPWNPGTLEPWNPGTLEPWNPGTLEPCETDPFALSFYLITRYEEYLPFKPDAHGRFSAEQSIAFKESFLRIPLVDMLVYELKKLLQEKFPGINLPGQPFRFIPSFDIDIAFAHLGKGWTRAAAAWAKLFLKADFKQIKERISTLAGKISDPYDNFILHKELAEKYGYTLLYFVLLGNFSRFDRNTSYKSLRFRKLISGLSQSAEMGLHPSYRSYLDPEIYEEEKRRLGDMVNVPVMKNRFHFLRLKFPESYRLLISHGITDDYSLGYSTLNGFRASTCTPFLFYDLQKEEITNLRLHPFIFMDSAMTDHLKMTPGDAISEITSLVSNIEKYGGEAIGIWHNYSLSEKDQYKGWQEVLLNIFEHYQKTRA